jgi:hypothetical protein
MTSERIKEIQQKTAYPDSVSVQQALLQVWNECSQLPQQEISDKEIEEEAEKRSKSFNGFTTYEKSVWVMACKWYREQLKIGASKEK